MSEGARGDVREPFVQPCVLARLLVSSLWPTICVADPVLPKLFDEFHGVGISRSSHRLG
jgi:hypothetical protein